MSMTDTRFADLQRRNPEWRPWLDAVREVIGDLGDPKWDAAVPAIAAGKGESPLAQAAGLDPAQAPLALLYACRRRWAAAVPPSWSRGYCPICGAWPGFAEVCGVERVRYLRCVRCGAAWRSHAPACAFCGNADHGTLGSLVAADASPGWAIEVCQRCRSYLKAFTRLTVGAPESAILEDLGSVELDLAAEARGYRRPPGTGHGACVPA